MDTSKFLFVNASSIPLDCKARDRARASAKSHAARISHARLESQRQANKPRQGHLPHREGPHGVPQDSENLLQVPAANHKVKSHPNILRFRLYTGTTRKPPEQKQPEENNGSCPAKVEAEALQPKLAAGLSKSSLDPFMCPAADLSVEDKHLLHFYLLKTPNEIFGSVPGPVKPMIMQANLENLSTNEAQLLWCLIAVESHEVSFQPTASARSLSVLRRRARAYDMMQARVLEGNAHSDDFLVTLGLTAAIELRMGNTQHSEYHTRALKRLIDFRGGLKAIRQMNPVLALMVVNMLIEIGIPGLYEYRGLLANLEKLRHKIQRLQNWNYNVRKITLAQKSANKSCHSNGGSTCNPDLVGKDSLHLSWWHTFNEPGLYRYIEVPPGQLTNAEYRFYLAMLFFINTTLWAFRDNKKAIEAYTKDLSGSATASKSTNFILQCFSIKLPSILLLILLAHHVVESLGRDTSMNAVFSVEELLDFVELMMIAKPKSRDMVLKAMWSWLSSSNASDITLLSAVQLDALVNEVENQWLDSH